MIKTTVLVSDGPGDDFCLDVRSGFLLFGDPVSLLAIISPRVLPATSHLTF